MMASKSDIWGEFRTPGSRFDRMMTAIERGACLEEMMDLFEGMDKSAYNVLLAIRDGTTTCIDKGAPPRLENKDRIDRHKMSTKQLHAEIFRMLDEGMKLAEIMDRTGLSRSGVSNVKEKWRFERGA